METGRGNLPTTGTKTQKKQRTRQAGGNIPNGYTTRAQVKMKADEYEEDDSNNERERNVHEPTRKCEGGQNRQKVTREP